MSNRIARQMSFNSYIRRIEKLDRIIEAKDDGSIIELPHLYDFVRACVKST